MNEPITRDENTDTLTKFRRVFHEEIIRHRARRLDLFLRLQFPDEAGDEDGWTAALNPSKTLECAAPVTVGQHKLFKSIGRHFDRLASAANEALAAAANRTKAKASGRNRIVSEGV